MYTENLLMAALVLLPGIAVYAWQMRPDVPFYEVSVVKQSASAVLGGMGGAVLAILGGAGACLVPEGYSGGYRAVLCVLLLGITCLMYRKNNRIDLREL